jgi:hypothetical protein
MTIEADLRTALLSFSAVTALVGTSYSARIRPYRLQQDDAGTSEHIIIEVDSVEHLNTLDGLGGRVYADVTLRCIAPTLARANTLAEAVRTNNTNPGTGLAGYSGTVNGHQFDAVLMDESVNFVLSDDGRDEGYYSVLAGYNVTIEEST